MSSAPGGFTRRRVVTPDGVGIHSLVGGSGPPVLLLHGCPQTSAMWRHVAPVLARRFTVVTPDLRGYGESSCPPGLPDHSNYSFRAMALDQVHLMEELGFTQFRVAGHDRGGRVAHRLALDHVDRVQQVAVLDILPTLTMYDHTDSTFATAYWEWFFLTQQRGFPEALISAAHEAFLDHELGALRRRGLIADDAWTAYAEALAEPGAVHGMCEDYRAGATIDLEHDRADLDRRVECPLLALWGTENVVWDRFDVLQVWRDRAVDVTGQGLPCGHYLAEEEPVVTAQLLADFFASG
jgi:haloacetate dehalogenase